MATVIMAVTLDGVEVQMALEAEQEGRRSKLAILAKMDYIGTIALTAIFTVLLLVVYKLVVNPQIVITPNTTNMAKCPDGWAYDSAGSICRPNIETQCMPFDPDADALQTPAAKCNLARTCGTTWSGMCI